MGQPLTCANARVRVCSGMCEHQVYQFQQLDLYLVAIGSSRDTHARTVPSQNLKTLNRMLRCRNQIWLAVTYTNRVDVDAYVSVRTTGSIE